MDLLKVVLGNPQNSMATMKNHKPEEEDALTSNHGNSLTVGESSGSGDICKSSMSLSNPNTPKSDYSYQDEDDMNDDDDDVDEDPDYSDNFDFYDDDDFTNEDDYTSMQSQFDNVDLPPGVEASLPWLKDFDSSTSKHDVASGQAEASSKGKGEETKDVVIQQFKQFKQFDTVDSFTDHFYEKERSSTQSKNWAKKIQEEWKILDENLPETIFVRACESRMELLRAVIIGPPGTPYHDGLFFFDCFFPPTYPAGPPKVHYHSGGLRLNPNLYKCGKVCLSLLGTWHGRNSENWIADKSTMLQVLVSIQALILNEKPFFNEPGYASTYTGSNGEIRSKQYNENTFILSLKTMMYTLRRPPKHFEDFVAGHFRLRAVDILSACSSYVEGNTVGSAVHDFVQSNTSTTDNKQSEFQSAVRAMMSTLIAFFTKNGSTDCDMFRIELYDLPVLSNQNTVKA